MLPSSDTTTELPEIPPSQLLPGQEAALYEIWERCFYDFSRVVVRLGFVSDHYVRFLRHFKFRPEEVRRILFLDPVTQAEFIPEIPMFAFYAKESVSALSRIWVDVYNEEDLFKYYSSNEEASPIVWSQPDFTPSVSPLIYAQRAEGKISERAVKVLEAYCAAQVNTGRVLMTLPMRGEYMEELCLMVHERLVQYFELQSYVDRMRQFSTDYPDMDFFSNQLMILQSSMQVARSGFRVFPGDMAIFRDALSKLMRRVRWCRDYLFGGSRALAVSVARKYASRVRAAAISEDDLVQEGYIGLMRALYRFEYRRGNRFSSYAMWWVKHTIKDYLSSFSGTARLPIHQAKLWHAIRWFKRDFSLANQRDPTYQEIAAHFNVSLRLVADLHVAALTPQSLDAPVDEEGESSYGQFLADPMGMSPRHNVEHSDMAKYMDLVVDKLSVDDRDLIIRYFGLRGNREESLGDIARQPGSGRRVSREAIRQRLAVVLKKAKRLLPSKERSILAEMLGRNASD